MTKEIMLSKGRVALVDDEDFEWINQWKWHFTCRYAARREGSNRTPIYMHAQIANTPPGMKADHRNGNGLDNRRENLRTCTQSENGMNRGKQVNNTSGFKGVDWSKYHNKWRAKIEVDQKSIHLGYYADKNDAARSYDLAALKYHGEFAKTNFEVDICSNSG